MGGTACGPISRSTYGSAPTWSSWPCVSTIASMSSARSRRYEKSGSTRSMPSWSGVGNISPVSTTTIAPSYSTTVMFLPISPSPPRGRTRRAVTSRRRRSHPAQQAVTLEHRPDRRLLVLAGLDHRQAETADVVADHGERRLDRDWVDGHRQRLPGVVQRGVDLGARVGLVDHPAHLAAEQVRGDGDASGATVIEHAGEHVVVAREQRHPVDRLD